MVDVCGFLVAKHVVFSLQVPLLFESIVVNRIRLRYELEEALPRLIFGLVLLLATFTAVADGTGNVLAQTAPSPTSSPPVGTFVPLHPTLYVISQSADPATAYAVTLEVALRMSVDLGPNKVWVRPEATWAFSDFLNQCTKDESNLPVGALMISSVENDSGTDNYLLVADGYTTLYGVASLFDCRSGDPLKSIVETTTTTASDPSPYPQQESVEREYSQTRTHENNVVTRSFERTEVKTFDFGNKLTTVKRNEQLKF